MPTFHASVTLRDEGGNDSSFDLTLVAPDQATAVSNIQGIVEAVNNPAPAGVGALPLTLGKVVGVSLTIPIVFSGWTLRDDPAAGSENQKGGRFVFTTQGGYTSRVTIPTFNEALKTPQGYIDTNNPAVFSFYSTGMLGVPFTDYRADPLDSLKSAYVTYGGRPAFK